MVAWETGDRRDVSRPLIEAGGPAVEIWERPIKVGAPPFASLRRVDTMLPASQILTLSKSPLQTASYLQKTQGTVTLNSLDSAAGLSFRKRDQHSVSNSPQRSVSELDAIVEKHFSHVRISLNR